MNGRERFKAIMNYGRFDRLPVWFFDTWAETRERWQAEGLVKDVAIDRQTGMDRDWESGMWEAHGLARVSLIPLGPDVVMTETADHRIVRTGIGAVVKEGKHGSSIPEHLEEALKPTRESWHRFKKMLDPADPRRRMPGWEAGAARFNRRDHATCFHGGALFGWARDWMGVEEWSCLPYEDPALYEEIIAYLCDYFIELYTPILAKAEFEFAYIFEDCCFKTGPLISPALYRRFYHRYYRRLVDFYHAHGVDKVLLDSDGKVDLLIPLWLESGIDIIFPIEVGTWQADPVALRREFGRDLRMMGGVDKHIIPKGEQVIRAALQRLRPLVEEGGYIPIPDHRIPPDCSLEQFRSYVNIFKEVFARS
jgi:uroporphyrinogen decarboxylase